MAIFQPGCSKGGLGAETPGRPERPPVWSLRAARVAALVGLVLLVRGTCSASELPTAHIAPDSLRTMISKERYPEVERICRSEIQTTRPGTSSYADLLDLLV